ncbi:MAG TPA: GNAT family N-acetyltransferase [Thermoanaerobaculia bacterium]|nr:GNAT family N-acetyltransferase [Thermoanaerobaculia bacterium]
MEIRRAVPSDSERLTIIIRAAKAHWGYPAEWLAAWHDSLKITAEEIEKHATFVAEEEGTIMAVAQVQGDGHHAVLEHLWVDPAFHGRGVGRALVQHARGLFPGTLMVVADPNAERFYIKVGGRRVGDVAAPMPGAPKRALPLLEIDAMP